MLEKASLEGFRFRKLDDRIFMRALHAKAIRSGNCCCPPDIYDDRLAGSSLVQRLEDERVFTRRAGQGHNPLKSGPSFGQGDAMVPKTLDEWSQSPQIGPVLRTHYFLSFPSSSLGTPCPGSSSFPPATAETRRLSRELARISKWSFPSFPSSSLGTGSPKLQLLHSCVPKLQLGNKKQKICTLHHYSIHTERSYVEWIVRFVRFYAMRRGQISSPPNPGSKRS
jgi:hypothetical protein